MISNYCRLCMAEEHLDVIDSFILSVIRNEFGIAILPDDELSKEICRQCAEFVLQLTDFKKNVINVQKVLQKMLKTKNTSNESACDISSINDTDCNNSGSREKKDEDGNSELENQENVNLIRKVIKSIDFNQISGLNVSKLTWHPNGTFCEVCCVRLKDHYTFLKHVKSTSHAFKSQVIKKYGKSDIFRRYYCAYTCAYCSMIFTSKKTVCRHSKEVHRVTVSRLGLKPDTLVLKNAKSQASSSRLCNISKDSKETITGDVISSDERLLKEVDTNVKTEPRDDIIVKSEGNDTITGDVVNPKRHPCKFCARSFCFLEGLSRHVRKHHPGKNLCVKCGFISVNSRLYSKHLRTHYNLTRSQRVCSDCFKICNDYAELYAHRKLIHGAGKSTFLCSECGGTFSAIVELKEHKRQVHWAPPEEVSKTKLRCKKCNRQFASALVLKLHQCTAKKYSCLKKCGKRFEFYTQMERHMTRCTKGRTIYTCKNPQCKKKLSCLQTFKNHVAKCSFTSHEERKSSAEQTPAHETTTVDCNLCNISFETENAFERHYEECHKKLPLSSKPEESMPRKVISSYGAQKRCENQSENFKLNKKVPQNVRNLVLVDAKQQVRKTEKSKVVAGLLVGNATAEKNFWRCKKCREKYFSIAELESHFSSCRGIQTQHVKCHCGAIFVDKKVLRLHKIVDHQGDKSAIAMRTAVKVLNKISKTSSSQEKKLENRSSNECMNVVNNFASPNEPGKPESGKPNIAVECSKAEINTEKKIVEENGRRNPLHGGQGQNDVTVNKTNTKSSPNASHWKIDTTQKSSTSNNPICRESIVASTSSTYDAAVKTKNLVDDSRLGLQLRTDINRENPLAKQLNTFACLHCGLVFNSEHFQRKHEQFAHQSPASRNSNSTIPVPLSRPHSNYSSQVFRNDEKKQNYQTRPSRPYVKHNYYHYGRYHPTNTNRVDRNNRSLPVSEKYDDPYRWRANRIESDNNHSITPPKESTSPSSKNVNQLTITSNTSSATCEVCRNPNPHLFCTACRTCYRENQVQYINHMKMKHS